MEGGGGTADLTGACSPADFPPLSNATLFGRARQMQELSQGQGLPWAGAPACQSNDVVCL